ncbi:hypothetical protein AAH446_06040 [Erwinia sp. P6884]|uniref:hypothetical protein n=1 Tax=Erwinia sp. P6884 TaxID=3141450 RepID=UPI00319AA8C6
MFLHELRLAVFRTTHQIILNRIFPGLRTGSGGRRTVNVRVMQDCLIITRQEPQPEPPAEPEVVTTLRKVCKKLSARKQREIAAYIELVAKPQKRPRRIQEGMIEWRSF